jgi:glutamate-ammonia-ligase adenylyltransferase
MSANLRGPRKRVPARGGQSAAVKSTAAEILLSGAVADLAAQRARDLQLDDATAQRLAPVLAASDFAFDVLRRHPEWTQPLQRGRPLSVARTGVDFPLWLTRRQHAGALECIAADILGGVSAPVVCARMSALAELSISAALRQADEELQARHGSPLHAQLPVQLVVFGMGKLGGGELNFSSDLDLITAFSEHGETNGARPLDHQEYFARQTRRTAQLLGEPTVEGQAWRIDLRLRPFGQSGQLSLSFAAMEQYFQREGRDWERYAWIKARPVAGAVVDGLAMLDTLRPFIYRRYLDYAAFEGLREMKALIDAEVRRQGMQDNLKLGPGGIREIEFLVQLEQLIRAGRAPALRTSGTLSALRTLAAQDIWPQSKVDDLSAAYLFLRRLENRVQMIGNAQTHDLPNDPMLRERLAQTLGLSSWDALIERLDEHRTVVSRAFAGTISNEPPTRASSGLGRAVAPPPDQANVQAHELWQGLQMEQGNDSPIAPSGVSAALWQRLLQFAGSGVIRSMSARSRARLDRVVPLLWSLAQNTAEPEATATRLIDFLLAVARRTAYLALLAEQPQAARMLVRLIGASAWAAQRIVATPILLDELIDPRLLKAPVNARTLAREWQQVRAGREVADDEVELEALKQFQQSVMLRLTAQFLFAARPAASVARALAELADQVLKVVTEQARRGLRLSHGALPGGDGFAVVAYGSLGGRELNFASDLDLVFIYDERLSECDSDGPRALDGHRYFVRLAQRILHLLTVATVAGPLYAVDTRLRPDGGKGLLVSAFDRFGRYQLEEAWTWEHQALVRARIVLGDPRLSRRFNALRAQVLRRPRALELLASEVRKMRTRLRSELDRSSATRFDLKQGRGGLVDIEFALQALVLGSDGERKGTRTRWPTGTDLLIKRFSDTLLQQGVDLLKRAHRRWLRLGINATLSSQPRVIVPTAADKQLRAAVQALLGQWLQD